MSEPVIPERLWITSYVAGANSSVLGRGLHFRSIQNSEADAREHLGRQAKPGSEYPRVDEYILAVAAESGQAATIERLTGGIADVIDILDQGPVDMDGGVTALNAMTKLRELLRKQDPK